MMGHGHGRCRGCGLRDGDDGERAEVRPAADRAFVRAFALQLELDRLRTRCANLGVDVVHGFRSLAADFAGVLSVGVVERIVRSGERTPARSGIL